MGAQLRTHLFFISGHTVTEEEEKEEGREGAEEERGDAGGALPPWL